eukprot:CAMPEP_0181540208 /NCGR_PEP_ID=MMETSP1110-20121109/76772_1 /TAXON_ID=174948 /ORGANISM="Symbiodinium sp., Strain CCMP421" /LENGTH=513 /DNA_ID=CAMNT_0023671851 /DNA_START=70 /DNA_END=1607 /DNA_ORIENTATION=+
MIRLFFALLTGVPGVRHEVHGFALQAEALVPWRVELSSQLQVESSFRPGVHGRKTWQEECRPVSQSRILDYCQILETLRFWSVPLLVLWVLILMWLLNTTADVYFVPPLEYWAARLQLSPVVAGATLVAAGNGAPDLFVAALAPTALDSVHIVLCDAICVLCVAGAAVLLVRHRRSQGGPAKTEEVAGDLAKDDGPVRTSAYVQSAGWLVSSLAYLAWLLSTKTITFWTASVMPGLYLFYLIAICMLDDGEVVEQESTAGPVPPLAGLQMPEGAGWWEMGLWAIAWPTYVLRWMLIPPSDYFWDRDRRIFACSSPLALVVCCCWSSGTSFLQDPVTGPWPVLALGLCASLVLAGTSDNNHLPKLYPVITLLAKVSSVLLLLAVAQELTTCCKTVAFWLGMSRFVLETTVVPWGNSLGDLVTVVALVKKGQSDAATTALFASPLFNVLVSAGATITVATRRQALSFDTASIQLKAVFVTVVAAVLLMLGLMFEKKAGLLATFGLATMYVLFLFG